MRKIAFVVGARPNFVKLAPVSKELRKSFKEVIIHTGQHYDYELNKVFFDELGLSEPDYHLGVGSGAHGYQVGEMLKRVEKALVKEVPGLVLVFGDTNSTLAGALAASKLRIKIAHVEAGLRSFNKTMPEEINRILVDHCSDLLFCPTVTAIKNLKNEGIIEGVHLTGDVMVDALKENLKIAERKSKILKELDLKSKEYFLATVHRAENVDDPARLKSIVEAFHELEDLVFPCHPRTERRLKEFDLWSRLVESIRVIKPVAYWDMLMLERGAKIVLTDSGGVQKEAYLLKTPCITLRENTEWIETIKLGANHLVGSNKLKIIESINKVIRNEKAIKKRLERLPNPFGDGRASEKMASIITSTFLR